MKKSINSKKLKAIKALADRGIGGEKKNAERIYKELSARNKKPKDTKEIKNAKMYINKKLDLMCSEGRWEKTSLKTMLSEKFKIRVEQIESIGVARDTYDYLIWLTHLAKGIKYKKNRNMKILEMDLFAKDSTNKS